MLGGGRVTRGLAAAPWWELGRYQHVGLGIDVYHLDVGPKTGAACLAHSIDYCFAIDPISEEKAKKIKGMHTARIYPHAPHGLWFNLTKKPFNDVRVRQAMNLVLDKAAIADATQEMFPVVR